jgi:multicomponent Na+:H+ antiporter subunit D
MSDLLPLLVAVPIVAAVVTLALGYVDTRVAWPIAVLGTLVEAGLSVVVAARVYRRNQPLDYAMGGFDPPFGIELVVDGLSAAVVVLVAVVALGVLAYMRTAGPDSPASLSTFLLLLGGLAGMTITGDAFNLYVFLEITGLAAYALVATGDRGRAAVGALKYLIVGTVGASVFLLGVGYAFLATGTLNMADLATKLAAVGYDDTLVRTSFVLVVLGLGVKSALYPLHTWQPEAYASAPDSISGYVAALVSTVSAYALARMIFSVYTVDFLAAVPAARIGLLTLAGGSIVAGAVLAVTQTEIKRTLAYSSVSQFGLVVAGFTIANGAAVTGATIHLLGHAVMKGALFLGAGAIAAATGARSVREYNGLFARRPVLSVSFGVLALSMVGVPPAVGFVGKWYIAVGAVEAGAWPIAVVILASTLLTLAYFARLIERMFFRAPASVTTPTVTDVGSTDGVAADGGNDRDEDDQTPTHSSRAPEALSTGMIAVVVLAAVLAVVLGGVASTFGSLLEPTLDLLLS